MGGVRGGLPSCFFFLASLSNDIARREGVDKIATP